MSGKLQCLGTTATLLSSIYANERPRRYPLDGDQLDRIAAGTDFNQLPSVTSSLVNGSNGSGGVNQFSLSIVAPNRSLPLQLF
jgi:hypothetical protein